MSHPPNSFQSCMGCLIWICVLCSIPLIFLGFVLWGMHTT